MMDEQLKLIAPYGLTGVDTTINAKINVLIERVIEAAVASPNFADFSNEEIAYLVDHAIRNFKLDYENILIYVEEARK